MITLKCISIALKFSIVFTTTKLPYIEVVKRNGITRKVFVASVRKDSLNYLSYSNSKYTVSDNLTCVKSKKLNKLKNPSKFNKQYLFPVKPNRFRSI